MMEIKNRVGMAIFIYMKIPDVGRRILKEYPPQVKGKAIQDKIGER